MRTHALLRNATPFLLALLLLPACAGRGRGPDAEPQPVPAAEAAGVTPAEEAPDVDRLVEDALARSQAAYRQGLEALAEGDLGSAWEWFHRSRQELISVDPSVQGDPRLVTVYRSIEENIEVLEARMAQAEEEPAAEEESALDRLAEVEPPEGADDHHGPELEEPLYDVPITVNDQVRGFLNLYTGDWRKQFEAGFRRSGRYVEMIRRVFAEEGIPQDLAYIAHVESSYKPRAYSRARAYGLWQFMAATGRNYGLHRDYWVDERADPEKATRAAARYLTFLHEMFGDWYLAMAAYNAGEFKVQRAIRATGSRDFWHLARTRNLRRETKNFVPAILAAIIVYKSPEDYGFDPALREAPLEYDLLDVDGQADLQVLADCAGTSVDALKALNPELRLNVTPPRDTYSLRVPSGSGTAAREKLAAIPLSQRVREIMHVVRNGETLSHLARRYGTSVAAIQSVNGIRNPRAIRVGTALRIPLTEGVHAARAVAAARIDPARGESVHVVARGENPYLIARAYRVPLASLLAWNGLDAGSVIHPGDRLRVVPPTDAAGARESAPPAPTETMVYVVRSGDTPSRIARAHGMSLGELLSLNGMHSRSIIHPGQQLRVAPGAPAPPASSREGEARIYVVRRGDTLYDISRAHGVRLSDLCRWNGISSQQVIRAGDRLTIYAR